MILGLSTCFRVGLIGECVGSIKDSLRQCCHLPCWYFCNCVFSFWWEYFWATHARQWTLGLFLLYTSPILQMTYGPAHVFEDWYYWTMYGPLKSLIMLSYFYREIRPWRPYRLGLLGLAIFIPSWDKSFDGHLLSLKDIYTYQSIKRNIIRLYNLFFFFLRRKK